MVFGVVRVRVGLDLRRVEAIEKVFASRAGDAVRCSVVGCGDRRSVSQDGTRSTNGAHGGPRCSRERASKADLAVGDIVMKSGRRGSIG